MKNVVNGYTSPIIYFLNLNTGSSKNTYLTGTTAARLSNISVMIFDIILAISGPNSIIRISQLLFKNSFTDAPEISNK